LYKIGDNGGFMNGLYVIWPDYAMIDKAIAAGVDTLLVTFSFLPGENRTVDYFDKYETSIACCRKYKGLVKVLAGPNWISLYNDVVEEGRMIVDGVKSKKTPCPNYHWYSAARTQLLIDIYNQGLIDGIAWDVEHYEAGWKDKDILEVLKLKIKCECSRCSGQSWKEQWTNNADNIRNMLCGIPILGQMPYNTDWSMSRYQNDVYNFNEDTYTTRGVWPRRKQRFKLWWRKWRSGLKYRVVPGIFIETFDDDTFFDMLKYYKSSYGGYWIYNHKRFSANNKITTEAAAVIRQAVGGYYDESLVSDEFFAKLKGVNS
jgi:hypothetical protein